MNVFTKVERDEEGKRNVPMGNNKLVFSFKLEAKITLTVDKKPRMSEKLTLFYRKRAFLQVH